MCDSVTKMEEAIKNHLKNNLVVIEDRCWKVGNSALGDRGIFATRDIEPGEVIFIDYPIIIGPRINTAVCVNCYNLDNLTQCINKCGLPVCSQQCQSSSTHLRECQLINAWKNGVDLQNHNIILPCLTPLRSLFLNEDERNLVSMLKAHQHPKHEVLIDILKHKLSFSIPEEDETFMRLVCSVLDANAFEVPVGSSNKQSTLRGLYALGSLTNHACSPNTAQVFDSEQRMVVRATLFIPQDMEICISYTRLIWGTLSRRFHLLTTKHFACMCERCCDPSEYGTNLNGLKCAKCKNVVLPEEAINMKTSWRCIECAAIMTNDKVGLVNNILGSCIRIFESNNDVTYLPKILNRVNRIVPPTNQFVIELKYKLVWILGYSQGYHWKDLSMDLINRKEEICRELLDILWKLRTGLCKMRGLLLYELYKCLEEKERRQIQDSENSETGSQTQMDTYIERQQLLNEAADILMYDVGAPEELKQRWGNRSIINK